jgi:hypothetical protein
MAENRKMAKMQLGRPFPSWRTQYIADTVFNAALPCELMKTKRRRLVNLPMQKTKAGLNKKVHSTWQGLALAIVALILLADARPSARHPLKTCAPLSLTGCLNP